MIIVKTSIDKIKKYRDNYLNSMPEFQELFLELMINNSAFYLLQTDGIEMGYAIITDDGILIEFYLLNSYIPGSSGYFRQIIKELKVKSIYCKSFDSLLLDSCLSASLPYSVIGVLYRDYVEAATDKDPAIIMLKAGHSSVNFLLEQDDSIKELFETEQQLTEFINNGNVFLFYKNDEFIGCGMVLKTHVDWEYCDLGVWVNPSKRGNGIGSRIILNLREFAIGNNLKPSCGCAIDNSASQKAIEKAGFVSRHKLIKFTIKGPNQSRGGE